MARAALLRCGLLLGYRDLPPFVRSRQWLQNPNLLVSALIDHELGTWKHDRLRDLFLPVDVEAILKIPLGRTSQPDFAVWHYSADGRFSVRSAYHLFD
ncbi:UNVERIFIED_CONTAM: hypothetical protein Scaly_3150700 [Sesamum calycinum]|uniref:Uncharacterized protein n=1 Tax=Sesamum calycinum TaxID=2727403 RepID=A0AAW2JEM7_9LAMI